MYDLAVGGNVWLEFLELPDGSAAGRLEPKVVRQCFLFLPSSFSPYNFHSSHRSGGGWEMCGWEGEREGEEWQVHPSPEI